MEAKTKKNEIFLRLFQSKDYFKVLQLEKDGFGPLLANPLEITFSLFLSLLFGFVHVIELNDNIIGAVFTFKLTDFAYLCNAAILAPYRNKHIASNIGKELLIDLKNRGLELLVALVENKNISSLKMTNNLKFQIKSYYNLPFFGRSALIYRWL